MIVSLSFDDCGRFNDAFWKTYPNSNEFEFVTELAEVNVPLGSRLPYVSKVQRVGPPKKKKKS